MVFGSGFRLIPPWLLTMAMRYPASWSSFILPGTLPCHHFQSVASRPKVLPEADVINVESYILGVSLFLFMIKIRRCAVRKHTKSNAATFFWSLIALCVIVDAPYRPTRRLSLTTRHVIFSGSFLEIGVKKLATALLVVVDCCRRFEGGGERSLLFSLGRFPSPGRGGIFGFLLLLTILHWVMS